MNRKKHHPHHEQPAAAPGAPEASAPAASPATPPLPATLPPPAPAPAELELAAQKDKYLRLLADFDNFRKRTARDREDQSRRACEGILQDLLPVIDHFEMGMQAAAQDTSSMIYIGMDMVRRQLNDFLASQGVVEIPCEGKFDPNLHDALAEEECAAGEEGRILRVTRRGYKLRDRLLRPAGVVVSKMPAPAEGGED